ncbi:MAG: GNAT family N-acetyltransferase [Defluviitaleaceae bacterium]|nr:GNAT family N-acetyltransferase [Defluviitaleaceae bacterium]
MIRKMELADIPRIAEIHVFGWRSAYRGIISDEHLFTKLLVSKRITAFEKYIVSETSDTYVFDDGIIKAFLTIGKSTDEDTLNSFEVWGIYVDPFFKREGIGQKSIYFFEKIAIEQGFSKVCLWTLQKNTNARSFYEKLGYLPDGKSKFLEDISAIQIRYAKTLTS